MADATLKRRQWRFSRLVAHQRRLQVHAKVPLSLGVELPLELFVLGIVGSAVRYDENRLEETRREGTVQRQRSGIRTSTFVDSQKKNNRSPSVVKCSGKKTDFS